MHCIENQPDPNSPKSRNLLTDSKIMEQPMKYKIPNKQFDSSVPTVNPLLRNSRLSVFVLALLGMLMSMLTVTAEIVPYSWQRFTTLKSPGLDATTNAHHILNGFTGNGESPGGTMPISDNICVGGPLGPEGYFSTFSIRSRANRPYNNGTAGGTGGGNQGCLFEEPVPVSAQNYAGATKTNTSAWGNLFQTNDNWVVECWALPERFSGTQISPIFYTGLNRNNRSVGLQQGVIVEAMNGTTRANANATPLNDGHSYLRLHAVCPVNQVDTNGVTQDFYIGPPVLWKTPTNAEWMHIAVVRDAVAGTVSWYTNGVLVGATNAWRVSSTNYFASVGFAGGQDEGFDHTVPDINGNLGIGMDGGARPYEGYIAELRWSYFLPGKFSLTNLLTRRVSAGSPVVWNGPVFVKDPQNITVWTGGGAALSPIPASDTSLTYQWQRFSGSWANIANATNVNYILENAQVADSGAQFRLILTKPSNGLTATSGVATVTVVNNNASIVNGYSNAVMAESSLKAYFPVDGTSSGNTLVNVKNPAFNATMINAPFVFRNGNTNFAAGNQGLSFNTPDQLFSGGLLTNSPALDLLTNQFGFVEIPGNTPGVDFNSSSGNGTVEAVLYLEPSSINVLSTELLCWMSSVLGGTGPNSQDYAELLADYNGYIYYRNGVTGNSAGVLVWAVPGGLLQKRVHIAVTFQGGTNVTCYANGVSLGTKKQGGFGTLVPSITQPITLGRRGGEFPDIAGRSRNAWRGCIDDFAIYGSTLSPNVIASHAFILKNGTTPTLPSVAKISPSKFLYNGFPVQVLNVEAAGSPPFGYQWRLNGANIAAQTNASLNVTGLNNITNNYTVVITNSLGSVTSAPVTLSVIAASGYAAKVFSSSGGGPRAFWPLTETSGTDILDWAGTHDGVISGAYTLGGQGPVPGTGSVRFYGTNGAGINFSQIVVPFYGELNSYRANLDPDGTYPLTAFDGRYSYEFWYRPDSSNAICAVSSQFTAFNGSRAGAAVYLGYTGNDGENQTTFRYWTMRIGRFNNTNQGVNQGGSGGPTPPPIGQWCHVALVVDGTSGGDKAFLYMNGVLEDSDGTGYSTDPNAGFVWNANNLAPFVMGNRNRGSLPTLPMNGALSQVAVYDYPLTYSDITNHLSEIYSPASFTQQPVGTTTTESISTSVTLTAKAIGIPNDYRWVKDGVEITQQINLDGSQKYPVIGTVAGDQQGPFSQKLVISQVKPADSGNYWLRVYNPLNTNNVPAGQTNSAVAAVLINPDTVAPVVTDVSARGVTVSGPVLDEATASSGAPTPAPLSVVVVKFSKRLDPISATNPANYTISGGVTVTNVVLATSVADTKFGGDYRSVGLVTAGLTPGASYTATIANVYDEAQTSNKVATTSVPFVAPSLTVGKAAWNYYYRLGTGVFTALQQGTNGAFPYVPQFTAALTNFSSDTVNPGQNLGNVSTFSGQGDNYVSTITAWVTPTNTGYYEFFINGDDATRLYLNPAGSDPAGATWIGDAFSGTTQFNDIYSIVTHYQLTAGQPYFLQIVTTEGGGNDNARAGWRYLGTIDSGYDGSGANGAWIVDATNLPPIQSTYLSSYAPGAPSIISQPTSIVAAAGVTTNFAVTVSTGTGLPSYQWQVNNGNTGGNTNKLFIAPVAFASYSTNYKVIVSDGFLSSTSTVVSLTPPGGVTFTANPTNKAVAQGVATAVGATATTTSGRINYQWKLNGVNVSGANYGNGSQQVATGAANLTIASFQPTNAGAYTVAVDDGWFAVTNVSTPGNLTIANNPTITNSLSGSLLSLTFPSQVGPSYVLETKSALTNATWTTLSTNIGTGSAITVPRGATNSQGYFRVRMQ